MEDEEEERRKKRGEGELQRGQQGGGLSHEVGVHPWEPEREEES